jgi:cysteine synthase A
VSSLLKKKNPAVRCIVVEPSASPVLSGGNPGKHRIQGIGPGFIPDVLDTSSYDEVFTVSDHEATQTARLLAEKEGIFAGISSGANCFAAIETARNPLNKGKTIVFIICDTGERYVSTTLFNPE